MTEVEEYNLGYFEGLRNALQFFMHAHDNVEFLEVLEKELKAARDLRDGIQQSLDAYTR